MSNADAGPLPFGLQDKLSLLLHNQLLRRKHPSIRGFLRLGLLCWSTFEAVQQDPEPELETTLRVLVGEVTGELDGERVLLPRQRLEVTARAGEFLFFARTARLRGA